MESVVIVNRFLKLFSFVTICIFTFNGIVYSAQPLIDLHGFRQTQTAVTAYWMSLNSNFFQLNYPLPVVGSPWSTPFEYPLFQSLVALISHLTKFEIDQIGRLLALASSLLLLIPLYKMTLLLKLPMRVLYLSIILIYSSPQYLYWSRTFLIETFSVLLTFVTIYLYFRLKNHFTFSGIIWFLLFSTAAILVKVTTSIIPLLLLIALEIASVIRTLKLRKSLKFKDLAPSLSLLIAFLIFENWVRYADSIKMRGGISKFLTSSNLNGWTFGDLEQRISSEFWINLIMKRILFHNPIALICIGLFVLCVFKYKNYRSLVLSLFFLWFFPMLLFSNLHIVHDYYQTENLIYLLILTSIIANALIDEIRSEINLLVFAMVAFASNIFVFSNLYFSHQITDSSSNADLLISKIVLKETLPKSVFVGVGKDWNPTIPYYSKRYSVMVPDWFPDKFSYLSNNEFDPLNQRLVASFLICKRNDLNPLLDETEVTWLVSKWKLDREVTIENCQLYFKSNSNLAKS
jgi:hypothetical protein